MPHEHTSTRTRLLWTLGLTAAGIGLTLALDSPAHADDIRPETPVLDSATQLVDHTVRNVTELPAAIVEPADTSRPRPVRNLVVHTTRTVDTAVADVTGTVRAVTDTADKTTRPLPVLGETVDQVTDLTDTITGSLPALTPPTVVDAAPTPTRPAQPAAGDGSDDTTRGGTAPDPGRVVGGGEGGQDEDAPGAAPVPHGQAAAPGAHHPQASTSSGRAGATGSTSGGDTRLAASASRNTPDAPATPGEPTHCANTTGSLNTTANGEPQPSTPVYWAHHPPTHRRHTTTHTSSAAHRTTTPPAPSG